MIEFKKDKLFVKIADSVAEMGQAAADDIHKAICELMETKDEINIIFAAAPSQNATLAALLEKDIEWNRINAFHMDEYIGLKKGSAASFQTYLKDRIFGLKSFKSVNYVDPTASSVEDECQRYSALLEKYPVDIVILGIGENGHIAFNDPGVADFNDKVLVKPVKLDERCRTQQVNDGCFATIDDVPQYALTLTVSALTAAKYMFCSVPYFTKAEAIEELLTTDRIDEHCPCTVLRSHDRAYVYCDKESSSRLSL